MTDLLRVVRDRLDMRCLVRGGLRKEGCQVLMNGTAQRRLVIDFDKPGSPLGPDSSRCDFLFIAEGDNAIGWVAPLELKRGRLHANEVVRQLRAGASVAEELIARGTPVAFRPIAASRGISKAERNLLRQKNNEIGFHGRREAVRLLSCGEQLVRALRV